MRPAVKRVGLNHMAWRLESLDDLKEFYEKIKGGQPIDHISDHASRPASATPTATASRVF
jgi:hypothetical protein